MSMRDVIEGYFENAAAAQVDDLAWASDWSQDDDDYSGSAVSSRRRQQRMEATSNPQMVAGLGHHIMTGCNFVKKVGGAWTTKYKTLLRKAGIKKAMFNLNSIENRITDAEWLTKFHHGRGPHSQKYHQWVFDRVSKAIGTLKGEEAVAALKAELGKIADELLSPGGWLKLWEK